MDDASFAREVSAMPSIRVACGGLCLSIASCAVLGAGCDLFGGARTQPMITSAENSSGEGTVQAKAGENGNTQLEVRVKHLSPPSVFASDATVYVVWIRPRNADVQNVGALEVDRDLAGALETTTAQRVFTLTITPEPSPRMTAPTHQAVFTSELAR